MCARLVICGGKTRPTQQELHDSAARESGEGQLVGAGDDIARNCPSNPNAFSTSARLRRAPSLQPKQGPIPRPRRVYEVTCATRALKKSSSDNREMVALVKSSEVLTKVAQPGGMSTHTCSATSKAVVKACVCDPELQRAPPPQASGSRPGAPMGDIVQ